MNRDEAHAPVGQNGHAHQRVIVKRAEDNHAKRVVIFGGGLAGLAAAEALSAHGIEVELHEARSRLGGRASSFADQQTGEIIDNCQHVAMGCCTNYFDFCERTGLAEHFTRLDSLLFIDTANRKSRLRNGPWPAPFHLTGSFLRLRHFNLRERLQIVRALRQLIRTPESSQNFQEWLNAQQQSPHVQEDFWKVVLVSALSESLDRIEYTAARQVFVQGFLSHRNAWKVSLPTVPLHVLYGEHLLEHLLNRGVRIQLQSRLKQLRLAGNKVAEAQLASGDSLSADVYLLALPWHAVGRLIAGADSPPEFVAQAAQLEAAPISSVHLWFDRPLTSESHAVLLGRLSQWVFNRSVIQQEKEPEWHYYQVVISQSRELSSWSQEEIVRHVQEELLSIWPDAAINARLLHSRVVREHQAVFSVTPGSDAFRADQKTELANLFLAGDWTRTGWPATMEGAVRSGYLAAGKILQQWGIPATILRPDLTTSSLAYGLGLISSPRSG